MKKVLITGSNGVIGSVLHQGLSADITEFDLPDRDARDPEVLTREFAGHDAVIHLAWNTKEDNFRSDFHHPDNGLATFNVYRAAVAAGVPRVVMASSVHADKFTNVASGSLLDPYALPLPDSPYGAGKCFMEALGRYYADAKSLEVVCVRFGGVNQRNEPPAEPESERQVWLSHRDCCSLIQAIVDADRIDNGFAIVHAVSNNRGRVHDLANPLDWVPQDGAR